jgi:uncharacterized protein YcgI (DUF1989 family)
MSSQPNDLIELEVLIDCVVAVSNCPWDRKGFGKPTGVEMVVHGAGEEA